MSEKLCALRKIGGGNSGDLGDITEYELIKQDAAYGGMTTSLSFTANKDDIVVCGIRTSGAISGREIYSYSSNMTPIYPENPVGKFYAIFQVNTTGTLSFTSRSSAHLQYAVLRKR